MKHDNLMIFAQRLRHLRESKNLSTRALGEIIGTSNATISRYETGERDPDLMLVYNIAKYFNVSLEYICGEDINPDKETLINLFGGLSGEGKMELVKYATYLSEKERR